MKREITTTVCATLILLVAAAFGQESQTNPAPTLPAAILGPQLIVWSQLQEPKPVPQPLPPPDRPVPTPDQQPESGKTQAQSPAPSQTPAAQTFTGTINKDGNRYVLKVSGGNTYQLDDQDEAGKYEGKQVKVVGDLDAKGAMLHVVSIQLVS